VRPISTPKPVVAFLLFVSVRWLWRKICVEETRVDLRVRVLLTEDLGHDRDQRVRDFILKGAR
jgi:hypothetical protein